jgi:RNA recognition motif-containing protein
LAACALSGHPEKAVFMHVKLYVRNLSISTTGRELRALFAQAGDVTKVDLFADRLKRGSKGYAYVTMSTQNEADKAVSMFNTYSFNEHILKVILVKPRQQHGSALSY